jgi:hypothetical protein
MSLCVWLGMAEPLESSGAQYQYRMHHDVQPTGRSVAA